jgi:hypothetical protein
LPNFIFLNRIFEYTIINLEDGKHIEHINLVTDLGGRKRMVILAVGTVGKRAFLGLWKIKKDHKHFYWLRESNFLDPVISGEA